MKNVLLLVHDDEGQESRYQAALDLTRALGGHLTCVDVAIAPLLTDDYLSPSTGALLMANEMAHEQVNRAKIEARLSHEDVPWECVDAAGDLSGALERASRLADVIVVNAELKEFPHRQLSSVAGDLIVSSGKPVLAVPPEVVRFDPFGHAMVAWDGSAEADAALRAAIPILKLAKTVTLLEIEDGSVTVPAEEAAEYCSRHDIRPVLRRVTSPGQKASAAILAEVSSQYADYVVMGGFGRSRFVEKLFGGVTQQMFRHTPVPLFMAH
ncbi:universal stress protein [Stakelama marina]|uniref:Universal stress protein n=1 Tax=Stakelama marina TaxID=2826939 RepID=A0A8T4IG92_9SPHN|nr:universal stress protein [Stakelama marina]MBR0551269.1 universal stress protein [Stakelama marina]